VIISLSDNFMELKISYACFKHRHLPFMLIELFFRIVFYVFGGFNGKELGDLHVLDYRDHSWNDLTNQMTGDIPEERSLHVMCPLGSELFAFDSDPQASKISHAGAGEFFDDSFIFYPRINEWKRVILEETLADRPSVRG
jgi:hypothetical protein